VTAGAAAVPFRGRIPYVPRAMRPADLSEPTAPFRPRRPSVLSLVAVSMVSPLAINIIVPALPAIQATYGAPYGQVQLVLSLFLAAIALGQIALGPLSDRFGRRPVLIGGLAVFTLTSFAAPFAPTIEALIMLRVLQGASGCVGIVLGRAIIRDLFERREAAAMIGYVTMGLAVAPALAPLIGGLLQDRFGWTAIFWFMGAAGLACSIIAAADVNETNRDPTPSIGVAALAADFGRLLRSLPFLAFTLASALASGAYFSFLGGAPYVSEAILGLSPIEYGVWFVLLALGYSAGNFASARLVGRLVIALFILAGAVLTLAASASSAALFAAGLVTPAALFVPMLVVGFANGLTIPNAIAGAVSVDPEIAGAASGLSGAIQLALGAALAALAGALLGGGTATPLFAIMIVSSLGALAAALLIRRRRY